MDSETYIDSVAVWNVEKMDAKACKSYKRLILSDILSDEAIKARIEEIEANGTIKWDYFCESSKMDAKREYRAYVESNCFKFALSRVYNERMRESLQNEQQLKKLFVGREKWIDEVCSLREQYIAYIIALCQKIDDLYSNEYLEYKGIYEWVKIYTLYDLITSINIEDVRKCPFYVYQDWKQARDVIKDRFDEEMSK